MQECPRVDPELPQMTRSRGQDAGSDQVVNRLQDVKAEQSSDYLCRSTDADKESKDFEENDEALAGERSCQRWLCFQCSHSVKFQHRDRTRIFGLYKRLVDRGVLLSLL